MAAHGTTGGDGGSTGGTTGGDTGGNGGGQQQPAGEPNTTGGEIHADPARMRAAGRRFEYAADYTSALEGRFLGGTAALTGVWGTDDTGKKFEGSYLERLKQAQEALASVKEGLTALPESIDAWAKVYEQAAQDNAEIADGVRRGVSGDTSTTS